MASQEKSTCDVVIDSQDFDMHMHAFTPEKLPRFVSRFFCLASFSFAKAR